MKDSYEKRVQNQFGGFCVRVLKNEANRLRNENAKKRKMEIPTISLSSDLLCEVAREDRYFQGEHIFEVHGIQICVTGDILAKVLTDLPEKKRDIILLYYFPGLTDKEIGERMNVVRQNISKHRANILRELREMLLQEGVEWL